MNLYTKYRSQKFSEVVGQTHVVKVITSAISTNKIAHAYLFSGPRGTGKTTMARLLAKSLNCVERKNNGFEPCNKCQSCREINEGTAMDIIEIDAASNRGIDEIRALRDKVRFAASGKRYKVFIIDEVHMLTREAFNALLKTLEEPPKHVVFILATTELHKVPDTIISRTQQFDFYLHSVLNIANRLSEIAKKEGINIDKESIRIIANVSRGGMRDAISLLDQVSNVSEKIDEIATRDILGLASQESIYKFIDYLLNKDVKKIIGLIHRLYDGGADLEQFAIELVEYLRKILLIKYDYIEVLNHTTDEEKKKILSIVERINSQMIVKYIETFIKVNQDLKNTSLSYLPLEIAVFNLIGEKENIVVPIDVKNVESKENKKTVEKKVVIEKKIDLVDKKELQSETKNVKIDIKKIKNDWRNIVGKMAKNHSLKIILKNSAPLKVEDDKLVIGVEFKLYKDKLENKLVYQEICACIEKYTNNKCQLKFVVDSNLVQKISQMSSSKDNKSEENELASEAMDVFGE